MDKKSQRDKAVERVIIIEGLANLVVLIAKFFVGIMTGSLAIIGDAIHSLTDVINNIVAWMVMRVSSAPPDREHPYGHRKFETLAVFFLASLLIVLAFELAMHAVNKESTVIVSSGWGLAIMLGILVVNIALATWERKKAKELNSDILLADASHTFADVMTTIAIIVGWQLSAMGYYWLDRVAALAVSGFIFYLAYTLFKRALPVLTDKYALDPETLSSAVIEVNGVLKVSKVRSRWIGDEKLVDLVIAVAPQLSTEESHQITNNIETMLADKFDVSDISIHVEPYRPM
ncbi:cation diffusion facilitator family transporter [Kangiella sediminilitoris]|uniref:Cation transporter, cation diffusion facilitator (CDF) family protein n=1 Tax=Kangiella sediminilitoris TaxID=1144748 RepID=A0A1B3BAH6_9GAMM|nr:cation diffusion facilitator family transporter [Kangiella sediminilitoris]AOE49800.1 Cation transporter, cation diffusion facilitator (CDF) family protein [Kangiella sediminilitoris]